MRCLAGCGSSRVAGLGLPPLDFLTPRLFDCTKGKNHRRGPKTKEDLLASLTRRAKPPAQAHLTSLAYAGPLVKRKMRTDMKSGQDAGRTEPR